MFLSKYGSLDLYDEDPQKIFIIDHEQLKFDKNAGWDLIGIPEKDDGTLSGGEYVCIHDDLLDRNQSTCQDKNIIWKFLSNKPKIRRGVLPKINQV